MIALEPATGLQAGASWLIDLSGTEPKVEPVRLESISQSSIQLDVTGMPSVSAIAQAIRRQAGAGKLCDIRLVGTRAASSPVLEPELAAFCSDDLLGVRIEDQTQLSAPEDPRTAPPVLRALWQAYSECGDAERNALRDAIKLAAAGRLNPSQWREAPWARSS